MALNQTPDESSEHPLKRDSIGKVQTLIEHFPEFAPQLEDLKFYITEDVLGKNQPFLLTISSSRLAVARNEKDMSEMYEKISTFYEALMPGPTPSEAQANKQITSGVIDSITQKVLINKDKVLWRDISIFVVALKNTFSEHPEFVAQMKALRAAIHKGILGTEDFHADFDGIHLDIQKGDSNETMLDKLMMFVRKIEAKHPEKMRSWLASREREWVEEQRDRQRIWAVILSQLQIFKKTFKGSDFGAEIAELKDSIESYALGYETGVSITSPWWPTLSIEKWASLDERVDRIIHFIGEIQQHNITRIPGEAIIDPKQVIATKEADKVYWRDVVAGIDVLQKVFSPEEYPSLEQFKEMIENDEVGQGNALMISIGNTMLRISNKDDDKNIKNKIAVFIGELKQIAASEEADNKLDDVYWRDVLASLAGMEEAYGTIPDYRVLMMAIESGVLGTVKDFNTIIDGVPLSISMSDTDRQIRTKLTNFINELQKKKGSQMDQAAMKKARQRIVDAERLARELEFKYQEAVRNNQKLQNDYNTKIQRLRDELKMEKAKNAPAPGRSFASRNG